MKTQNRIFLVAIALFAFTTFIFGNDAVKWTFKTGNKVYSSPVIKNDTLFIGSLDSNFYAIDGITGKEIWRYNTNNEVRTTTAIYQNILCFESGNVLYGLNTKGELLWTDTLFNGKLINEHDEWDCFRSSPQLLDSIAYIGSENGFVFGVNVLTGKRVFEVQTPQANATIETTPAIYDNKIFVGDWLGVLSAFDINTQSLLWQYDTKTDNQYASWVNSIVWQPLIYDNTLYFGGRSCNLYSLNPQTGQKIWMYHQPGDMWLFGGPVASDGNLYVGSSYQQVVYAFNPSKSEMLWSSNVYGLNYGSPLIQGDHIIVGTGSVDVKNSGSLTVVNKNSHEIEGRLNVDGWAVMTPLFRNEIVYFGCTNGNIYAVNLNKLINHPLPNLYLKPGDIDLGLKENSGFLDSTFYVYNLGEGVDSVSITTSNKYVTFNPASFNLSPSDSQKVSFRIDLSGLHAGKNTVSFSLISNNSLLLTKISKKIKLELTVPNSLNQKKVDETIRVFPNPTTGITTLNFYQEKEGVGELQLYNILGILVLYQKIEFKTAGMQSFQFNASELGKGLYCCKLIGDNKTSSLKLIVED